MSTTLLLICLIPNRRLCYLAHLRQSYTHFAYRNNGESYLVVLAESVFPLARKINVSLTALCWISTELDTKILPWQMRPTWYWALAAELLSRAINTIYNNIVSILLTAILAAPRTLLPPRWRTTMADTRCHVTDCHYIVAQFTYFLFEKLLIHRYTSDCFFLLNVKFSNIHFLIENKNLDKSFLDHLRPAER